MLHELATTDGVRMLNDSPSSSDIANAVTDHVSLLMQLLQQQAMESEALNVGNILGTFVPTFPEDIIWKTFGMSLTM